MILQVGVKAIFKNSQNKYLLLRRTSSMSTDDSSVSWDIPGGRINTHETTLDALRREVREEIGHNITSEPNLIAAQDIMVPQKDLHVIRLTYVLEENVPFVNLSDEHDQFEWLSLEQAKQANTEPYLREVIAGLN